jgi:hypothetical protein
MIYGWSGGIDPLIIGSVPVKAVVVQATAVPFVGQGQEPIRSIYVEIDIRPGSGGTGINISLKEESSEGHGSLFRIENTTPMPIWLVQDAKASATKHDAPFGNGDCVDAMTQSVFGLTHPSVFQKRRQGHAPASLSSRLLVRVGLGPLLSSSGFDSSVTIVLDATKGDDQTISLFPSAIAFLRPDSLGTLQNAVIAGSLYNDGPTRVLVLK